MKKEQYDFCVALSHQVAEMCETLHDCLDDFNRMFGDDLDARFCGKSFHFYRNELILAREHIRQFSEFLDSMCFYSIRQTPIKPYWKEDEPRCPSCGRNIEHIVGYLDGKSVCECGQHIDWTNWELGNDA